MIDRLTQETSVQGKHSKFVCSSDIIKKLTRCCLRAPAGQLIERFLISFSENEPDSKHIQCSQDLRDPRLNCADFWPAPGYRNASRSGRVYQQPSDMALGGRRHPSLHSFSAPSEREPEAGERNVFVDDQLDPGHALSLLQLLVRYHSQPAAPALDVAGVSQHELARAG